METDTDVETDGDQALGNTKTKATRPNQLKRWFFTWNNYPPAAVERLETVFREICTKYAFQKEVGKQGTPHLQGNIWLHNAMRFSEFNLPAQIHWEGTKKTDKQVYDYVTKEDTSTGERYIWGFPKPVKVFNELRPWQRSVKDIALGEPDGRSIYWYTDLIGGCGKSAFAKFLYVKHNCMVIQGGKLADIINLIYKANMDDVNTLIIDVPRNCGNNVSYSAIECILNGMITNTKFETGIKVFNPPNVIVFCNYPPDKLKLSADRWRTYNIINNELE